MGARKVRTPKPKVSDKASQLERENKELRDHLTLYGEIQNRLGALSEKFILINRVSQELNSLDIENIGRLTVSKIPALIGAKYCSLFLYDYQKGELVLQAHNHPEQIAERIAVKHHRNTIMGLALARKRIVHISSFDDFERSNGVQFERTFAFKYASQSCISMPLMTGNYTVGILNFADKIDGGSFHELEDVPIVEQISQVLAMAIRNCNLFREVQNQAKTDMMTHLSNYRAFHEILRSEIHRSVRYLRPLTLIMIDVDDFKKVNDRFGHQAGDQVLGEVAQIILKSIRREDFAARYGGDEIAVILPETPAVGAVSVARRLVGYTQEHPWSYNGQKMDVTVSVGLAGFVPEMTLTDFINAADQALLEAKARGKNQFVIAGEGAPKEP